MVDIINKAREIVNETINCDSEMTDELVRQHIRNAVNKLTKDQYYGLDEKMVLVDKIYYTMRGFGAIQPYLEDDKITEIMINGYDNVFIEREGRIIRSDKAFESKEQFEDLLQSIVSRTNRVVNEASPIVDIRLNDGSRVNIVLDPISIKGTVVTIRKFPKKPFTMEDLIKRNTVSPDAALFLKQLVEERFNIFVCGGCGSGKTTLLNVLSNFIPAGERIITIEDSAELRLNLVENLVSLETRDANMEKAGKISIKDLIRCALRMRPDRIIVGEVRGEEAIDMLQAMNTGHDGSISTGHANSCKDMLFRLEAMVSAGAQLPVNAIRQQIAAAIDFMVYLRRMKDRTRKVVEITQVKGYKEEGIELIPIYKYLEEDQLPGKLERTENKLYRTEKIEDLGFRPEEL